MKEMVLILEKGCQDCSIVLSYLDLDKVGDSTYVSPSGIELKAYVSLNPKGTEKLMDLFEVKNQKPPVLVSGGKTISSVSHILKAIKEGGYSR